MSISTYLKSLGGHKGNKTRSKGNVNTKANKRLSNKAIRKHTEILIKQGFAMKYETPTQDKVHFYEQTYDIKIHVRNGVMYLRFTDTLVKDYVKLAKLIEPTFTHDSDNRDATADITTFVRMIPKNTGKTFKNL